MTKTTKILVTGAAGMIGFHTIKRLLGDESVEVYALDKNMSTDETYNRSRTNELKKLGLKNIIEVDLCDHEAATYMMSVEPDVVIHLAALAGVLESVVNPGKTLRNNHDSLLAVLEVARKMKPKPVLLYASSSSVYGGDSKKGEDVVLGRQKSAYAFSKAENERVAEFYRDNHDVKSTGLRFFTVYGEWNRKDMLMHYLLESFTEKKAVTIYGGGAMQRDFTYVGDVAAVIVGLVQKTLSGQGLPKVLNVGGGFPETLNTVVNEMHRGVVNVNPNIAYEQQVRDCDPLTTECDNRLLMRTLDVKFTRFGGCGGGMEKITRWYKELLREKVVSAMER